MLRLPVPARFVARLNAEIAAGGGSRDWIVWDLATLAARVGHDAWFDPARFHQAKAPFAIEICPLVADHLSRIVAAMTGKSARALVLDLDNTLWGGVIGETVSRESSSVRTPRRARPTWRSSASCSAAGARCRARGVLEEQPTR